MTLRSAIGDRIPLIADYLPSSVKTRFLGPLWTWNTSDTHSCIAPDLTKEKRLFIGIANFAGQGLAWAEAIREDGRFDARNAQPSAPNTHLVFPSDLTIQKNAWRRSHKWARRQFEMLTTQYTHVLIEAGRPILGADSGANLSTQATKLEEAGVKVAFLWHGSDIRSPKVHTQWVKDSPFFDSLDGLTERLEAQAARNSKMADELGLPEFVSTPHLLTYRPNATWLPILVNYDIWQRFDVPTIRDTNLPKVVHVPSKSSMKGTVFIRPVLQALHDEGKIEYVEISGIPPEKMPEVIRSADIVVELLGMNSYGTAALEAMSQGVPVVGQVGEIVRGRVIERTGQDVPIADTTSDTLREVVLDLAGNPDKRRELANAGFRFLDQVHSPDNAANILIENFLSK